MEKRHTAILAGGISHWLIAIAAVCSLALCTGRSPAAEPKVFKAGAFAMDITPTKFPVSSNGSMVDRKVDGAHDPLHARCLVLDDGSTKLAIVVCDSCMIPRDIFDAARQQAEKATGIPAANILCSATHTHTGVTVTGVFQSEPEVEYRSFLAERIAAGINQAHSQLEPAKIGWGSANDPSQVFNRRWFMKPEYALVDPLDIGKDRVRMNPPRGSDLLDKPSGPIDPEIGFLSVIARNGRPIALLANYSLHYVGGVPGGLLSADYFGEFAQRIAQRLKATNARPAFVGIMSNGTSGNINNINFAAKSSPKRAPFEQIQVVAASVADATFRAWQKIEHHDWVPLKSVETEIELGVRRPNTEELAHAKQLLAEAGDGPYRDRRLVYARESVLLADYPATIDARIQAVRIGDLGIVSSPCETFAETGLAVKEKTPFKQSFTIELANGYNGYLPTPEHHTLGGYETWRARSSYLAVDAEPKVRAMQLKLLRQLVDAN
ncbi:MAG: hypothetical protein ACYTGL_25725 [Planctomycetota bacterium]